ncbi:sulfite exporter TauE/SafE family protein [Virgibacillus sp. MSJ-26]|uniref:sulfite exporter TauE/SafE family protein n=1 Tax=Virgibacillus sp. MSJ-26 TaxID=2841522 RepID=UPI001C10B0DE|nr:sulfite exporter TauE/SafE family protein [Virgibacillus sp. MSJ-26]MBU5466038.1 sulfite exporter TauE/SafE family protein [Virgibacillus sp. MSJ-26]
MSVFIFILIILFASVLQTSTGFGFSIMATPFLLLLFDPREAIQLNLILSLFISSMLIVNIRRDVNWGVFKRFVIGGLFGLPLGITIFLLLDMTLLKLGVSLLIISLTILLITNWRTNQTIQRDFLVGGLSGLLTTSIGMPGPPLLLYFSGTNTKKATLRATTLAFYLFIYLASLMFQVLFAGTSTEIWLSSLKALPIVLVGLMVGQLLYKRISQKMFQILTYILLFISGGYLLFEQF